MTHPHLVLTREFVREDAEWPFLADDTRKIVLLDVRQGRGVDVWYVAVGDAVDDKRWDCDDSR